VTSSAEVPGPGNADAWKEVNRRLFVVRLSVPVALVVPALLLAGAPKSTRGVSLLPGRSGAVAGGALLVASVALGLLLSGAAGLAGEVVPVWLLGSLGVALMINGARPIAFVKPICTRCRLLPVIKEHESIHLAGVSGEDAVWRSMRSRQSEATLHMQGDPAICLFCPIPKRLAEN
jgi:hypothetical protein